MPSRARMRRRNWMLPIVAAGITASGTARADAPPPSDDGSFVATDDVRRPFHASYEEGYRPGRREPYHLRTAVEMVGLLGIGSALYYFSQDRFEHSEYPNASDRLHDLRASFDTNAFDINALGHPASGTVYQLVARTNGHSIPVAFVYSALTSAVWELALEFPEHPSINDFVITPSAGLSTGEFLVHAGDYFNSTPGRPRWYHEVLGWVFGTSHRVHRALDGYQRPSSTMPADRLGYSSYYSHRFDLLAGPMRVANDAGDSATGAQLRLQAEIVSIPGFLRPGRFALNFSDGDFVETLVQANIGDGATAWDVLCNANLFGRYAQNISEGERAGVASMFAFSTAARYSNRSLLGRRDNYYVAHVGGPAVKLWAVNGDFIARLEGAVHLDFGAIRSHAFPEHAARFGNEAVASVLVDQGYYFALGGSGVARGTLSYKALELGSRIFFGRYESIDRGDRFIEHIPHAIHTSDGLGELEGWVGLAPRDFPLQVRAFFEHIPRSSTMLSITTARWDQRYGVTIGANL